MANLRIPTIIAIRSIISCLCVLHLSGARVQVEVRDAITHHPLAATVTLEGPEIRSFLTDERGQYSVDLSAGEYTGQYSAQGYRSLRTRHTVTNEKVNRVGAFLDPQRPPASESPEAIDQRLRPAYTLLHQYVVDSSTGEPLADVTVRASNAQLQTQTDSSGHFWLPIPTPKPASPGGVGSDTVTYEKKGYKKLVLRNFAIATEDMGGNAVDLERGNGTINVDATHKLLRDDPIPEARPLALARPK